LLRAFFTVVCLTTLGFLISFLTFSFSADVPVAHGIHFVAPVPFVYSPSLQGVHSKDPYVLEIEFLGHSSHDASPVLLLYVPGLHL